jgi:Lon protease-like protein
MRTPGTRFDVAVFPLINTVLFPGVTLPLHIFEERYRQMLKDVQARGWPLAISLATPQEDKNFSLSTICGAGDVQIFREYGEKGCDILVHGQQRVKLCSIIQSEPYFVMEAEAIESDEKPKRKKYEEFLALVKTWAFINPKFPEHLIQMFDEFASFGDLADFFVFHFIKEPEMKQVFLNCTDPMERAEMLSGYLEQDLARLSKKLARSKKSVLLQ